MDIFDIIVIGGGPSGMMAAGTAAAHGAKVLLLEKNKNLGIKLLMTGNGRCNITNNIEDVKKLAAHYGEAEKFLYQAFYNFTPEDVRKFFADRGVRTKVEDNNRVLPESNKAEDISLALLNCMKSNKVTIVSGSAVRKIVQRNGFITKIILADGREFAAKKYILATGGKSYPTSGSSGDGYGWLKKMGHRIVELKPALAPINLVTVNMAKLEGLSLRVKLFAGRTKKKSVEGDVIFTKQGISGPAALNLSRILAKSGETSLIMDCLPDDSAERLEKKLAEALNNSGKKEAKTVLKNLLPERLAAFMLEETKIGANVSANEINKKQRRQLIDRLKNWELEIDKIGGFDRAMVTVGGVDLAEINPRNMKSKIVDNLYLAGEILNIDGPTGGFNLQSCWSTGHLAGRQAALELLNNN